MVVEAPTGAGKSAIAVTLAREASSAYILTAQKILQDQYLRDFPELAVMKGRGDHPPPRAPPHPHARPPLSGAGELSLPGSPHARGSGPLYCGSEVS